jgi:hypothetical protein
VALATCNGARFLPAQLESLARQTTLPCELVVFDDASTDETPSLLAAFAERAPFPVRLTQNGERRGYRTTFVAAAARCAGDLIAFCDQDDVWEPRKLGRMAGAFDDPEVLLAFHDATLIDADDHRIGSLRTGARGPWEVVPGFAQMFRRRLAAFSPLQPLSVDHLWAVAATRDPPPAGDPPAPIQAHDQFYLFWAEALGKTAHVGEALVRYRQHAGALFGRPPHPLLFALAMAPELATGRAEAVTGQIALLQAAEILCDPTEAARLRSLLADRRAALPDLQRRAEIYQQAGLVGRLCRLAKLAAAGGYGRRRAMGPGFMDLALDLAAAAPHSLSYRKDRSVGLLQA